jgi:hypothetical protein
VKALEITIGLLFAIALVAVATYFAWRQRATLRTLRSDMTIPKDQRRFLLKQSQRRIFGSLLLYLLAAMLVGALFLDWDPRRMSLDGIPGRDDETAKQALRFLGFYTMSMLLLLLVVLALAVLDFWATARFGMQQQKLLFKEHQEMLEAELAEHRHRRAEMN